MLQSSRRRAGLLTDGLGRFEVVVLTKRVGDLGERELFVRKVLSDDPKRFNSEVKTSAFMVLRRNKV